MDITKDIHSLTTFRRESGMFMKQLKKSKRPMVLAVKGKATAGSGCRRLPAAAGHRRQGRHF